MKDQRIRDPIHNLVAFSTKVPDDNLLWELLQSAPVQRLRRIKQLGFSEFVYPGATHSRFSHVLGAMHMARRMLDVFERNNIFANKKDHPHQRRATLAAALLHDVVHGPYSHVFEEVAASLNQEQGHETYTQQIIEHTDIKNILRKHGVFVETRKFFTTEAGYDPYTRIISSQLDCDRLDFLVRDRYYTGIRSAAIDLAWLFDSLRIEEVPIDPVRQLKAYSFVVLPKGISVIEEFVLSYIKVYQNVYFHKTTRAVQHMVVDIIKMAVYLSSNKKIRAHPVVKFFKSKAYRTLDNYPCLDDSSIMSLLRDLADQRIGHVSKLAQRYFQRDTYKCIELPTYGSGEIRKSAATKFIERLQNSNVEFFDDRIPAKEYKQYDVMDENYLKNILVKKDNEYEPLGWNSEIVKNPPSKKIRLYFKTSKDRDRAIKLLPSPLA